MGELTYLMGVDGEPNAFYDLAKQFFTAADANVIDPPAGGQTLEGVLAHLATLTTEQRVINLVSHTNGFAAMEGPVTLADQQEGRRTTTVHDLNDAVANKLLAPPSPTVVTANTRVVIYGCDVGRVTRFLTLLSTLLGNPGELLAPRRLSVFYLGGTNVVYRQAQTWSVVRNELLLAAGGTEPAVGWPAFRDKFVAEAVDKLGATAIGSGETIDVEALKQKLTTIASAASTTIGPTFFIEESIDIHRQGDQTAAAAARSIPLRSNGDPVTTPPASLDAVDDTTVVTIVGGADAFATKPDESAFAISIVVLAKMIDAPVVIAENDGYRRITTSPARAPSPGPKPMGGGATTGGDPGGSNAFAEDLRALLDELLADGAPQADIDAILAAVPQGDATADIVTDVPDAPPVPDDLASLALPPEEVA